MQAFPVHSIGDVLLKMDKHLEFAVGEGATVHVVSSASVFGIELL